MNINEIISKCKKGERQAQFQLYNDFVDMVSLVCERYSLDIPTTKDNIQITFIKAFTNLKQYDAAKGHFQTWLKRIAINQCLAEYKKRKRIFLTPNVADIKEEFVEIEFDIEHSNVQIKNAIDSLPTGYRTVFLLNVVDDLSHKEIAAQLNISENTSRTQLFKAKKMLKNNLSDWHQTTKAI